MAERKPFEFFLLRYVPNAVRDEFVNIGLIMTESGGDGGGFADVYFTKNWGRARCLDPTIDVDVLEAFKREIKNKIANAADRIVLLHELMDRYSNTIQLSPVWQCLTEDPVREMKYLASTLVEMPIIDNLEKMEHPTKTSGRSYLHDGMTKAFKAEGIWDLLSIDIPASPYTVEGDPLKFDFAYQFGKEMKIFQALSFVERVGKSANFARAYAGIAPRLAQLKGVDPILTAVVEDHYNPNEKNVQLAVAFIASTNGRVERLSDMPDIARTARLAIG